MIKRELIILTGFLLVIGIIDSICAVVNVNLRVYFLIFILGLMSYILFKLW